MRLARSSAWGPSAAAINGCALWGRALWLECSLSIVSSLQSKILYFLTYRMDGLSSDFMERKFEFDERIGGLLEARQEQVNFENQK